MYAGGKVRTGARLAEIIKKIRNELHSKDVIYYEPFAGYLGVLQHMAEDGQICIANDINKDVIKMWEAFCFDDWKPTPRCSKEEWDNLQSKTEPSKERGFYGCIMSWNGCFFYWYRFNNNEKGEIEAIEKGTTYLKEIAEKVKKNISFMSFDYSLFRPKNMLIYCDPPYKNNKIGKKEVSFKISIQTNSGKQ